MGNRIEASEQLLSRARDLYRDAGDTHAVARATAGIARAAWGLGRLEDAIALGEDAYSVLAADEPDRDTARLASELARLHYFAGSVEASAAHVEIALEVAERTRDMALLASSLNTKALGRQRLHPYEAYHLLYASLQIALDHDLVFEALRAYNNLAIVADAVDRVEEILPRLEEALLLARRRGDRNWANTLAAAVAEEYFNVGRWDEAEDVFAECDLDTGHVSPVSASTVVAEMMWHQGRADEGVVKLGLAEQAGLSTEDANFQRRQVALAIRRVRGLLEGDADAALEAAELELQIHLDNPETIMVVALLLGTAAVLAPAIDDMTRVARMAAATEDFAGRSRAVTAQRSRLEGVIASLRGDHDDAVERFGVALAAARSVDFAPWIAGIQVDYAASLVADERREDAEPLLAEAREIAERLRWVRLLTRIEELERAARGEKVPA